MDTEIKRGLKLIETLKEYHHDFPPNALAIFMLVSEYAGITSGELVERVGISKASVSRNLRMMGDRISPEKEGLNLIRMEHAPEDYRVRRAYLTERGHEFLIALKRALA
ncbi:MarR family winged helix-turn-helix transcriptional regulator [Vibrio parahaemolyticus]|uniref:MarR family winged helix-turn-helix transcriptional regulator n=1 Tax=Vibrio parahaemolyticus TaxID=670 RepID=UPI0030EF4D13